MKKEYLICLFIIFVSFFIGYNVGYENICIKRAYNYILENPSEYINFINESYEKQKELREACLLDIDNCPAFINEKRVREKQYKDNLEDMEKSIDSVKENIINNFSNTISVEDFTIDKTIGGIYSSSTKKYGDTLDVLLNF